MTVIIYEIGYSYHVKNDEHDFTGVLLEIYTNGTGLFQSVGTGKKYRIQLFFAKKLG